MCEYKDCNAVTAMSQTLNAFLASWGDLKHIKGSHRCSISVFTVRVTGWGPLLCTGGRLGWTEILPEILQMD